MCALRRKDSALARRIKDLEKELSSVNSDLKTLVKVVKKAEHAGVEPAFPPAAPPRHVEPEHMVPVAPAASEPRVYSPAAKPAPVEVPQYRVAADSAAKKQVAERDSITKDGRFATYLMSRDFHNVRPLRHERNVQRNRALFVVALAVAAVVWVIWRFF